MVNVETKNEDGGEGRERVPVCLEQFSPISSTVKPALSREAPKLFTSVFTSLVPRPLPAFRVTGRDSEKVWQKWPKNVPVQREKIPRYCSTKTCFFSARIKDYFGSIS